MAKMKAMKGEIMASSMASAAMSVRIFAAVCLCGSARAAALAVFTYIGSRMEQALETAKKQK
jgi:hypothetical protein